MSDVRIGVIGGSGLYRDGGTRRWRRSGGSRPPGVALGRFRPRASWTAGRWSSCARHGAGTACCRPSSTIRANIYGFKTLGVELLISVSAVGSLKKEYVPGDIVVPDQFFDRTRHRPDTFFGNGIVAHVSVAHPVCAGAVDDLLEASADAAGAR